MAYITNDQQMNAILNKVYEAATHNRIKTDMYAVRQKYASLHIQESYINLPEGPKSMLSLVGTLPIQYKGNVYYIPIIVWLSRGYPFQYPVAVVTPTNEMSIKPKHPHVGSDGKCYLPYITNWKHDSSTLVGLCDALAVIFGNEPPVYAKQNQPQPVPANTNVAKPVTSPVVNPVIAKPVQPQPQPQPQPPKPQPTNLGNSQIANGRIAPRELDLRSKVMEKIEAQLLQVQHQTNDYQQIKDTLERNSAQVDTIVQALQTEKKRLDDAEQALVDGNNQLDEWIAKNESINVDVDSIIVGESPLDAQMLDQVAEDSAYEDLLYTLNTALHQNAIDIETFLKLVRSISRDQFFARSTTLKGQEAQRR